MFTLTPCASETAGACADAADVDTICRRNYTTKFREQFIRTSLISQVTSQHARMKGMTGSKLTQTSEEGELWRLRELFHLIRPLFKGDPAADEGMKLQLNERVVAQTTGDGEDIKDTFLSVILHCLNHYPWFSQLSYRITAPYFTNPLNAPNIFTFSATPSSTSDVAISFGSIAHTNPTLSTDSDDMIALGQVMSGIQQNLMRHGFRTTDREDDHPSDRQTQPDLLSLCMLPFGRSPLSTLIQPMIKLFTTLLQAQPAANKIVTSASAISLASIPTTISPLVESTSNLRTSLPFAFLRLFQQNPNITKELLPFIRLFRQHGIKPKGVIQKFNLFRINSSMNGSDAIDDRPINMWVYFSQWLTLDKIEFLLRWLLEEPNLGELYDPNYRLDWGDGRGEQTILSYITHLKDQHPHHTALQFYHQILVHLSHVVFVDSATHLPHVATSLDPFSHSFESDDYEGSGKTLLLNDNNESDEAMDANLELLSASFFESNRVKSSTISPSASELSSSSSLSSVRPISLPSSVVLSLRSVVDPSSFREWLEDGLHQMTSSRIRLSARLLERLTQSSVGTTNHATKSNTIGLTPVQKASLHEAVAELLLALREYPSDLNLLEEDAYGNILFHTILSLPTYELIRLKSVEKQFLSKIDSLPSTIMSDFRRVLGSQSVNELFTETLLFNNESFKFNVQLSQEFRGFQAGTKIFPNFHPDTLRLEVTGIQWWQHTDAPPTFQLWNVRTEQLLAEIEPDPATITPNAFNKALFRSPITLTPEQHSLGVIGTMSYKTVNAFYLKTTFNEISPHLRPHPDYRLDEHAHYQNRGSRENDVSSFPQMVHKGAIYLVAPIVRKVTLTPSTTHPTTQPSTYVFNSRLAPPFGDFGLHTIEQFITRRRLFQPLETKEGLPGRKETKTIAYQSITCLPEYESKSFEELRSEDDSLVDALLTHGQPKALDTSTVSHLTPTKPTSNTSSISTEPFVFTPPNINTTNDSALNVFGTSQLTSLSTSASVFNIPTSTSSMGVGGFSSHKRISAGGRKSVSGHRTTNVGRPSSTPSTATEATSPTFVVQPSASTVALSPITASGSFDAAAAIPVPTSLPFTLSSTLTSFTVTPDVGVVTNPFSSSAVSTGFGTSQTGDLVFGSSSQPANSNGFSLNGPTVTSTTSSNSSTLTPTTADVVTTSVFTPSTPTEVNNSSKAAAAESNENSETMSHSITSATSSAIRETGGLESPTDKLAFAKDIPLVYAPITPSLLYGRATPTIQIGSEGQMITVTGSGSHAPLDFLFSRHSPFPIGEFIYQLFDRLLSKALLLVDTQNPSVVELIQSNSIGNIRSYYTNFITPTTNIVQLHVWLNLFQSHSIHLDPSSSVLDVFTSWIQSGDLSRIQQWFAENHSTDALWPTRLGGDRRQRNESLLDTAKRLHPKIELIKYLQSELDQWYDLFIPLIRINLTEHLIPDLGEIVLDYFIPSRLS